MGKQIGGLSGLPMTDPHKRVGAYKGTALRAPAMEVRQIDQGMWDGPALMNDTERNFVKYLKQEKAKNPDVLMKSTRGGFLEAIENAYKIGKGAR